MFFTLFYVPNNNCSIYLYNRYLQTTIIIFTRNVPLHKTDWILSELPLRVLSWILYLRVSSLMENEGEYLCLLKISINVNKLFIVICVFCLRCPCSVVVACLLVIPFFILMLLPYFCLFIDHVNKSIALFLELLFIILITQIPIS